MSGPWTTGNHPRSRLHSVKHYPIGWILSSSGSNWRPFGASFLLNSLLICSTLSVFSSAFYRCSMTQCSLNVGASFPMRPLKVLCSFPTSHIPRPLCREPGPPSPFLSESQCLPYVTYKFFSFMLHTNVTILSPSLYWASAKFVARDTCSMAIN